MQLFHAFYPLFTQQENVTAATEKAKSGVTSLLGGISKALTVEAEDLHQPSTPATQHVFNRAQVSC